MVCSYLDDQHVNDARVCDVRVPLELLSHFVPACLDRDVQPVHLHCTRHLQRRHGQGTLLIQPPNLDSIVDII